MVLVSQDGKKFAQAIMCVEIIEKKGKWELVVNDKAFGTFDGEVEVRLVLKRIMNELSCETSIQYQVGS